MAQSQKSIDELTNKLNAVVDSNVILEEEVRKIEPVKKERFKLDKEIVEIKLKINYLE